MLARGHDYGPGGEDRSGGEVAAREQAWVGGPAGPGHALRGVSGAAAPADACAPGGQRGRGGLQNRMG